MFARSVGNGGRSVRTIWSKHPFHDVLRHARPFSSCQSHAAKLQAGDRVLLRWKAGKTAKRKLTKPLCEGRQTIVDNHVIKHEEIIGHDSDVKLLQTSKDGRRRLNVFARHPSLEEFTNLSPRRVAPIYASYASTIVSLLDINVDPPSPENDPEVVGRPYFEVLEAGTGHGSLTLHLARAVALGNPPAIGDLRPQPHGSENESASPDEDVDSEEPENDSLTAWRKRRRTVIHTVDVDPRNRKHADSLIQSYRGGMYWPHIDFHTGDVRVWLKQRPETAEQKPFLDIVTLDMPGVESYISAVASSIKDRGLLMVFVPQITQIASCVQEIAANDYNLKLEQVVELGDNISTGRFWDVRMARLKHVQLSRHATLDTEPEITEDGSESQSSDTTGSEASASELLRREAGTIPPMVCRPIVGDLTRGGGFVALWKKVARTHAPAQEAAAEETTQGLPG